ncbi:hypothetical protein C5E45_29050 [Nocardia nova]|uniref:Uncharacterized protein n=1 Tax=Nocardia nova TaxID=37330 RepID=A0A2S6AI16_9NOCA|nr:hypothetical protein C5E41_24715 [Nocardia nova]PPJ34866.1 hypothetical protein C5E45_29050 [Nocardia nova]
MSCFLSETRRYATARSVAPTPLISFLLDGGGLGDLFGQFDDGSAEHAEIGRIPPVTLHDKAMLGLLAERQLAAPRHLAPVASVAGLNRTLFGDVCSCQGCQSCGTTQSQFDCYKIAVGVMSA